MQKVRNVCQTCRYWSETIAYAEGGGQLNALCLNEASSNFGRYMTGGEVCGLWQENTLGAVDDPERVEAYEEE